MKKDSFILHIKALNILDDMDDEFAGRFIKIIYEYQKTKELPDMGFAMKLAIKPLINQFQRDDEKYEKIIERNRKNGSNGGRPKDNKTGGKNKKKPSGLLNSKPSTSDNEVNNPENPVGYLGTQETHRENWEPKKADNDNDNDNEYDKKEKAASCLKEKTAAAAISESEFYEILGKLIDVRVIAGKRKKKPIKSKASLRAKLFQAFLENPVIELSIWREQIDEHEEFMLELSKSEDEKERLWAKSIEEKKAREEEEKQRKLGEQLFKELSVSEQNQWREIMTLKLEQENPETRPMPYLLVKNRILACLLEKKVLTEVMA